MNKLKVLLTVFILFISFSFMNGNVMAADNTAFSVVMDVSQKQGDNCYVITADISNSGTDFSGTYVVKISSNSYSSVGYAVDISIPSGGTKTYEITVPSEKVSVNENVYVNILNKNGKKVYEQELRGFFNSFSKEIILGTLSDKPDSLMFMDMGGNRVDINNESCRIRIKEADEKTLKDSINSYDILAIDRFDTTTLSDDTIAAVITWVKNGGRLILGTGEDVTRATAAFPADMLDATVYSGSFMDVPLWNDMELSNLYVCDIMYGDSYSYSSNNYVRPRSHFSGSVLLASISLADIDLDTNHKNDILVDFYTSAINYSSQNVESPMITTDEAERTLDYMEKPSGAASGIISFFIVIYVILVGPLIYIILKAMKKREKIWIVIPCISLAFVAIIFVVGLTMKVSKLNVKSIVVHDLIAENTDTYVFGYASKAAPWNVDVPGNFVFGTADGEYRYSSHLENNIATVNNRGDHFSGTFYPKGTFEVGLFDFRQTTKPEGKFDIEIDYSDINVDSNGYLVADIKSITNRTGKDLDYVFVFSPYGSQLIEGVKNNENTVITLDTSYTSSSYIGCLSQYANPIYKQKKYDEAAEVAAMLTGAEVFSHNCGGTIVAGVTKGKSVSDKNEQSWEVYISYEN